MKPVLGSLGANTLVILTADEVSSIRKVLEMAEEYDTVPLAAFDAGLMRGTAHMAKEEKKR